MTKSQLLISNLTDEMAAYLRQCRVPGSRITRVTEDDEDIHFPPTPDEVDALISYLRAQKTNPAIIGSVGLLKHLAPGHAKKFRPTVDIDFWVNFIPPLLDGWKVDPEAIGVTSWISPTGGYVDFLTPSHEFPSGAKTPKKISIDDDDRFPVGSSLSIMWLKLNSTREKDLMDVLALVRSMGRVPEESELTTVGRLNRNQRENLALVRQWHGLESEGGYEE